jgi:PiT family inorganic phosphate transporter
MATLIRQQNLVYNDEMDQQLKSLRQEKKAYKKRHKEAFERLSELQQIAYTHAMVRDADVMNDPNFHPEDLESDYYRGLHAIKQKRNEIQATRALESWVLLIAALGAMVAARPRFPTWR